MNPLSAKDQAMLLTNVIKSLRENWDYQIELFDVLSRLRKAEYDAYINANFAPEQALELVKAGIKP